MRDLRDFFNPNLTATIGGHEFTVPCPTAAEGLRIRMIMATPEKAKQLNDFEEINRLFHGDEDNPTRINNGEAPTGGLWDELWEHDVTYPEAIHLGITAVMYYGIGENVALLHWESLGKGLTATQEEQTNQPAPKPTPKNIPKPGPKPGPRKKK